jgi:hypothetical protein
VTAPEQEEPPPEEDSGSLIPAILAAYGAYMTWRGANEALPTSWAQTALKLGLRALIALQLSRIAIRALTRQRARLGRAGDELLPWTREAADAGVEAGIRSLAEALMWTDTHSTGDPVTKDANDAGQRATVPTAAAPPDMLAQMVAAATANGAQWAVGMLAGWKRVRWMSQHDDRVRETHVGLDGQTIPLGSVFVSPTGATLRYPHDPLAPIEETANCRCGLQLVRR